MSSSLSPGQFGINRSPSSPEGTTTSHDRNGDSPLNLGFLKSLAEKKTTREGNPPKRRGPKPDSKPALTRRQELNRQAQRTHRERKELYIKALEDEVLRLKELFSNTSQSKESLITENKYLKTLLTQHGIPFPRSGDHDDRPSPGAAGASSDNSAAPASYASFSPGSQSGASTGQSTNFQSMSGQQMRGASQQPSKKGVDFEQAGIDFVLTKLSSQTPFGHSHTRDYGDETNPGQGTWEISRADLSTLLDLSQKLDLDGEITPVMAWGMILNHPRFGDFKAEDFATIAAELGRKVRCYGFGAVVEGFELRDAFENVLPSQPERAILAH
ncbi:hypothetical protein EsHS_00000743 [Epichloe bromicola]